MGDLGRVRLYGFVASRVRARIDRWGVNTAYGGSPVLGGQNTGNGGRASADFRTQAGEQRVQHCVDPRDMEKKKGMGSWWPRRQLFDCCRS